METPRSQIRAAEQEYMAPQKKKIGQPWPWYAAAVALFLCDRALKGAAMAGAYRRFLPFFEFSLFKNTGIAFSLPLHETIFWSLALPVFCLLVWMFYASVRKGDRLASIALIFIIFGATSNLHDRIAVRATIDYLLFFGRSAVNIADGMIVGGVLALMFRPKKGKH